MSKEKQLTATLEVLRDCPVLKIVGTLDASTAPTFRHDVEEMLSAGYKNLLLDLTLLDFMDSSGIGSLIYLHRSLHDQGGRELWVAGCNADVRNLLTVTQLDKQIRCFDSLAQALDTWKGAPVR